MTVDRSEPPIRYTATAADQVVALFDDYEAKERPAAMSSLLDTLENAWRIVVGAPDGGLPAPTPYPQVARKGFDGCMLAATGLPSGGLHA